MIPAWRPALVPAPCDRHVATAWSELLASSRRRKPPCNSLQRPACDSPSSTRHPLPSTCHLHQQSTPSPQRQSATPIRHPPSLAAFYLATRSRYEATLRAATTKTRITATPCRCYPRTSLLPRSLIPRPSAPTGYPLLPLFAFPSPFSRLIIREASPQPRVTVRSESALPSAQHVQPARLRRRHRAVQAL